MLFNDFLSNNLIYLRRSLELTILELADITGVDPIDLYEYEKGGYLVGDIVKQNDNLKLLANYYTIRLADLVFSDIEKNQSFTEELRNSLLKEQKEGIEMKRSDFYKLVHNYQFIELGDNVTEIEVARQMLSQIHQLHTMVTKYKTLRKRGDIDKIDFYEGGLE